MKNNRQKRKQCTSRRQWLAERRKGIGGSDAAVIMGASRYRNISELWQIKTGRIDEPKIVNRYVDYGAAAEKHLMGLFMLNHPHFQVVPHDNKIIWSKDYPFIFASLDGEYKDEDGNKGIVEIKTGRTLNWRVRQLWQGTIPQAYLWQILHYMIATGYDRAVLQAFLISKEKKNDTVAGLQEYWIYREDFEAEISRLIEKESEFWEAVEGDYEPAMAIDLSL